MGKIGLASREPLWTHTLWTLWTWILKSMDLGDSEGLSTSPIFDATSSMLTTSDSSTYWRLLAQQQGFRVQQWEGGWFTCPPPPPLSWLLPWDCPSDGLPETSPHWPVMIAMVVRVQPSLRWCPRWQGKSRNRYKCVQQFSTGQYQCPFDDKN